MVLVTGATGFVGSNIVKELLAQGYQVRGLVHSRRKLGRLQGLKVETAEGDITNLESLSDPFKGVKYLFSCVGIIYETKTANFDSIHVLGVKNLVKLARENKVEHFVHISAQGTGPGAKSRYHQTKYRGEQEIINSGLTYTVFRPSIIFGPEDDFVNRLARTLKFNPVFPIISGGGKLQPVYINDLAKCAVSSLTNPAARNQIFEIGGPEQMTLLEIINVIRKIKGYGHRFHPSLPYSPVFCAIKVAEKFVPKMPVTTDQLIMLKEDNTCDNSSIERVFSPKLTSLEPGLSVYLRS
ncbi:MAG: hypothetical protein A2Z27_03830 [candidate division Zixibacteria bacterium RBG_16_50_21]|nr:MAG: hypothetical protein A2Z27_03830 [candidate division Zixibacteria bacterium RBG_16_50_21]